MALGTLIVASLRLKSLKQDIQAGEKYYRNLQQSAGAMKETGINFDVVDVINSDTIAWLYSPETPIDYPVVTAPEYGWYFNHLPDQTENTNGTLFLDANNLPDFTSKLNIIYGKKMSTGGMLGSLVEYKEQAYYNEHPVLYLYTKNGNYKISLKYGCAVKAGEWRERAFQYEVNLDTLFQYAQVKTTFSSNVEIAEDSSIMVLSAGQSNFDDERYIVIGTLEEI